MNDTARGFTLVRVFDATPQELWEAWTDPDEAALWWHPKGVSTPRDSVAIDARVGGRYSYTMINDATGESYPTGGVYLEVDPYERLAFTWGRPDADTESAPLITVSLTPQGERTQMTFTLTARGPLDSDIRSGWESALDILADHVQRSGTKR